MEINHCNMHNMANRNNPINTNVVLPKASILKVIDEQQFDNVRYLETCFAL